MSAAIGEVTMELNELFDEKSLQVHSKKCDAHIENFSMQEYCTIFFQSNLKVLLMKRMSAYLVLLMEITMK